jgi:hypothetical protein
VGKSRCAGDHYRGHRDNRARVSVRRCSYSVPARYAGRRLPVRLAARTVEIYDGPRLVARDDRAVGRYVEVLARLLPAAGGGEEHARPVDIEFHISASNPTEESLAVLLQAPALASMT